MNDVNKVSKWSLGDREILRRDHWNLCNRYLIVAKPACDGLIIGKMTQLPLFINLNLLGNFYYKTTKIVYNIIWMQPFDNLCLNQIFLFYSVMKALYCGYENNSRSFYLNQIQIYDIYLIFTWSKLIDKTD